MAIDVRRRVEQLRTATRMLLAMRDSLPVSLQPDEASEIAAEISSLQGALQSLRCQVIASVE